MLIGRSTERGTLPERGDEPAGDALADAGQDRNDGRYPGASRFSWASRRHVDRVRLAGERAVRAHRHGPPKR